jgi:2,3-bisphosphoglycerate-independent phosphoglycerate mutase
MTSAANPPARATRLLWLMLDGWGLAAPSEQHPAWGRRLPTLAEFGLLAAVPHTTSTRVQRPLDTTLGVAGLPQSATGQTSLLAGHNAAALMQRHYGPWPGPTLRPLLAESLPVWVARAGGTVALAGHYPASYREALAHGKLRANAIAVAAMHGGATMGEGIPPPLANPKAIEATDDQQLAAWGAQFAAASATLTIFDAWWSDHLGHKGTLAEAGAYLERLDVFLSAVIAHKPSDVLLVITADHGNMEEMQHNQHTSNPIPLLALGAGAAYFAEANDLTDVAQAAALALGVTW